MRSDKVGVERSVWFGGATGTGRERGLVQSIRMPYAAPVGFDMADSADPPGRGDGRSALLGNDQERRMLRVCERVSCACIIQVLSHSAGSLTWCSPF